jgi:hypothetical protein
MQFIYTKAPMEVCSSPTRILRFDRRWGRARAIHSCSLTYLSYHLSWECPPESRGSSRISSHSWRNSFRNLSGQLRQLWQLWQLQNFWGLLEAFEWVHVVQYIRSVFVS